MHIIIYPRDIAADESPDTTPVITSLSSSGCLELKRKKFLLFQNHENSVRDRVGINSLSNVEKVCIHGDEGGGNPCPHESKRGNGEPQSTAVYTYAWTIHTVS